MVKHYFSEDYDEDAYMKNEKISAQTRSSKIEDNFTGLGRLKFGAPNFVSDCNECLEKLSALRKKFREHMIVMISKLEKLTKKPSGKINLAYMVEILQRLDYNGHYSNLIENHYRN